MCRVVTGTRLGHRCHSAQHYLLHRALETVSCCHSIILESGLLLDRLYYVGDLVDHGAARLLTLLLLGLESQGFGSLGTYIRVVAVYLAVETHH